MPRNSSIDIPHVAVTDHYIRRNPQADTAQKKITAFLGMNCVNNTNPSAITRARGFLEFYERYAQSPGLLDSALFYLDQDKTNEQTAEQNRDYIRVWFWQAKYALVTAQADQTDPNSINDAWTTYRIGESFYKQLQPEKALPWYRRTVAIKKFALDFQNKYATCLLSVGGIDDAAQVFQFILSQNPDYVTANANYGYILMQRGKDEEAYRYLDRARHLDPDHEVNLINLAVWYHKQGKLHEAHDALAHLLAKHPENHQAHVMIDDLDKNLK